MEFWIRGECMSNLNCLLIEDSKMQANIIMQMIAKCGWSVFTALDLEHGLRSLKSQAIDFVLTDLCLPDSDGSETVARIKEASPNSIVGAMTAGDTKNAASEVLKFARSQGAEFLLQKPFNQERLNEVLQMARARIENGKCPPLVLIIDDSSTIRAVCEKMLTAKGFRTVSAESIDDAFSRIDNFDLDVILTDLNMPGISPMEAIPEIRAAMPGVGIVVMTGQSEKDLHETLNLGADTTITKPFNAEDLAKKINSAILMANSHLLEMLKAA